MRRRKFKPGDIVRYVPRHYPSEANRIRYANRVGMVTEQVAPPSEGCYVVFPPDIEESPVWLRELGPNSGWNRCGNLKSDRGPSFGMRMAPFTF